MEAQIDRLKQDLKTIEQAVGVEPEYGPGHVWASIGWGINGVLLVVLNRLLDLLPFKIPTLALAAIGVTMWIGLPILLVRLSGNSLATGSVKERQSHTAAAVLAILLIGIVLWMSRMSPMPPTLVPAIMFVMMGSWWLLIACGSFWRRGLLVWAIPFLILGFACPFLPEGTWGTAMAATIAFSGFAGALILHLQLKAYHPNGKIAH